MKNHPDDLLGQDFTFFDAQPVGWVKRSVTIIAYDPDRFATGRSGWRLVGPGFAAAWVDDDTLEELFEAGVLA